MAEQQEQEVSLNTLKVEFKIIFKDGREFDQVVDLVYDHPSSISKGIDRCFARFYTIGYVDKQEVAEKLVCYGPHYIDRVEMVESRVQRVPVDQMPPARGLVSL